VDRSGDPVLVRDSRGRMNRPAYKRRARPRRRTSPSPSKRAATTFREPEVLMGVVERRRRVQIQPDRMRHTLAPGQQVSLFSVRERDSGVMRARTVSRLRVRSPPARQTDPPVVSGLARYAQDVARDALPSTKSSGKFARISGTPTARRPIHVNASARDPPIRAVNRGLAPVAASRPVNQL